MRSFSCAGGKAAFWWTYWALSDGHLRPWIIATLTIIEQILNRPWALPSVASLRLTIRQFVSWLSCPAIAAAGWLGSSPGRSQTDRKATTKFFAEGAAGRHSCSASWSRATLATCFNSSGLFYYSWPSILHYSHALKSSYQAFVWSSGMQQKNHRYLNLVRQ